MIGSAGNLAEQIIGAWTTGFTGFVTYIPTTINNIFSALFMDSSGNLTPLVYVLMVFGGIGLVVGLTYLVYNLVSRKIGA